MPCASARFLVQWLSQPKESLSKHMLLGTRLSGHLKDAAAARQHIEAAPLQDEFPNLE